MYGSLMLGSMQPLWGLVEAGVNALCAGLRDNRSVTSIELDQNSIGDAGAKSLADTCGRSSVTTTVLTLKAAPIRHFGIIVGASTLAQGTGTLAQGTGAINMEEVANVYCVAQSSVLFDSVLVTGTPTSIMTYLCSQHLISHVNMKSNK